MRLSAMSHISNPNPNPNLEEDTTIMLPEYSKHIEKEQAEAKEQAESREKNMPKELPPGAYLQPCHTLRSRV